MTILSLMMRNFTNVRLLLHVFLHVGNGNCTPLHRFGKNISPSKVQIILGDLFTISWVDALFYHQKDIAQMCIFYLKVTC